MRNAVGATQHEALHEIRLAAGWQFLHAHYVNEGSARRWITNNVGEVPQSVRDWRRAPQHTESIE